MSLKLKDELQIAVIFIKIVCQLILSKYFEILNLSKPVANLELDQKNTWIFINTIVIVLGLTGLSLRVNPAFSTKM